MNALQAAAVAGVLPPPQLQPVLVQGSVLMPFPRPPPPPPSGPKRLSSDTYKQLNLSCLASGVFMLVLPQRVRHLRMPTKTCGLCFLLQHLFFF